MQPTQILILDEEDVEPLNGSNESIPNSYHRSQSPGLHGTPMHVVHLQNTHYSSTQKTAFGFGSTKCIAQSPSSTASSPLRRRQPPPLHLCNSGENNVSPAQSRRSIWVPRQFAFASPNSMPMHQRHMQQRQTLTNAMMQSHDQKYNYEQRLQYRPTLPVARSMSTARTGGNNNNNSPQTTFNNLADNNNTGSLPRMCINKNDISSDKHQQVGAVLSGAASVGRELPKYSQLKQPSIGGVSAHSSSSAAEMQLHTEWSEQQRRRLYRIALNFFNKKPDRGIQLLIRWGFVEASPPVIARLFRERRGLSRQMIGEYLGTLRSPFHKKVLEHFIADLPMHNVEIDIALRQLLKHFRLPGEAQKIDHIIQTFAHTYVAYNPHLSSKDGADSMYILAFAVIMLNTDLHTPSLKDSRRMKLDEFIKNLCRVEEGKNLDKKMLAGIYERVKEFEFRTEHDHVSQVMKIDQCIISKEKQKLTEPHRRLISHCIVHQILDPNKRQSSSAHLREIILFNDIMLVCKLIGGRKRSISSSNRMDQYQLRYSSLLIGLQVQEFQNSLYQYGFMLTFPDGQTMMFNAKNNEDRYCFVTDIRESIAESTEMEQWRIHLEMERQDRKSVV